MTQDDMFKQKTIVDVALDHADEMSVEFLHWLPDNIHVWNAFVEQAMLIIGRGFTHYSSYTIVEVLRHHSAISEKAPSYKLNNNMRPYLARLFEYAYPQHAGLFERRTTTKQKGTI